MCKFCEMAKTGHQLTTMEAAELAYAAKMDFATAVAEALDKCGVDPKQFIDPDKFGSLMMAYADAHFVAKAVALGLVVASVAPDPDGPPGGFLTNVSLPGHPSNRPVS